MRHAASGGSHKVVPGNGVLPEGTLGPLETDIMQVVWGQGPVTTHDVHRRLQQSREIAYTTVMTVMGNLTHKGLLERRLEGRAYLYRATVTRDEIIRSQVAKVIGGLMDRFTEPAMSYLIGRLGSVDEARLTDLEAEVARLRRQRAARSQDTTGGGRAEEEQHL